MIALSLVSVLSSDMPQLPVTVFRLLRTFRIIRLFGKLKSLRAIINALTNSIGPVINAFIIMAVILCLYAIMAVTVFYESAPLSFGNLSRAIVELFRIAAGETWVEDAPQTFDDGGVNWALGVFIMSFILVFNWVLLQV